MILFVNSCVREDSRTKRLANFFISKKMENTTSKSEDIVNEVRLWEQNFPLVNEDYLKIRDSLISEGKFDDPMFDLARQFADADEIVIAAPFWDLSFPATLKQYIELINVVGVTFIYTEEGFPKGLCKAKKLTYVTTAGGEYFPEEFGYGYIKALAQNFYGISDVELIKATGLDLVGADVEGIISSTIKHIKEDFIC